MPTVILHSWIARTATVGLGALCALICVLALLSEGLRTAIEVLAWGAVMTWACALLWWMPQIRLETRHLLVRNAWRTWILPWQRVERCTGRWGLAVVLDDGRQVSVAAAPRSGGISAGLRYHLEHRDGQAHSQSASGKTGAVRTTGSAASLAGRPVVRPELVAPGTGIYRLRLDSSGAWDLIELYREQALELAGQDEPDQVQVSLNRAVLAATCATVLLVLGVILF